MTPAARVQAAIEVLDRILAGAATEQALTGWARGARYAGSKDRAAVRDHVFDAIRCRRSFAALGGGEDGRAIMLGALRAQDQDPDPVFSGAPHAPAPLTEAERSGGTAAAGAAALDLPDWLWPRFQDSLGEAAEDAALALRDRAGVHLRVNTARIDCVEARDTLARDGVITDPHPAADTALCVTEGARRIRQSACFTTGLVELQDAASQALALSLPLAAGMRVLDYCAGGGGKALAMAAQAKIDVTAHDVAPQRMRDLPDRAKRAGVRIRICDTRDLPRSGPFDLVLCDAPCSGSGSWRRAPDGKWSLTPDRLDALCDLQAEILDQAETLVGPGGVLAYATCSVLAEENETQVQAFLKRHSGWAVSEVHRWPLTAGPFGTDGFFLAKLTRLR